MQTQDAQPKIGLKDAVSYASTFACMTRVYKDQGWHALWRGNLANVLRKILIALLSGCTISMALYVVKFVVPFQRGSVREGVAQQLVAYGIAAIAWTVVLYPLEYVHTRLAVGTPSFLLSTTPKITRQKSDISFFFSSHYFYQTVTVVSYPWEGF